MEKVYQIIWEKIKAADAVLIGASNGLSISEGYHLFADNQAFRELFPEVREKYGIRCLLQGMSFPYPGEEEKWGYWTRLITRYVHQYQPTPQMKHLKELVAGKPHFIVTSNGEAHFDLAGFQPENIYEIEGNLTEMQCERACHNVLYPVRDTILAMVEKEAGGVVPTELVPRCPWCGSPMQLHYAISDHFIPNKDGEKRYRTFLEKYHRKNIVILELGIGWRNQMIKAPLMRLAANEPNAFYVTFNRGEVYIPQEITDKSVGIDGDIADALEQLAGGGM